MSVVGLTFGSGAKAIAAERRQRGERGDEREHARGRAVRSYQAKPAPSARPRTAKEASSQVMARR